MCKEVSEEDGMKDDADIRKCPLVGDIRVTPGGSDPEDSAPESATTGSESRLEPKLKQTPPCL